MHIPSRAAALAAMITLSGAAAAEDKIVSLLNTETKDGLTRSEVSFVYEGCEEECHVASLVCNAYAGVEFIYADVAAHLAAQAIMAENRQIVLEAGGKTFDFFIFEMTFAELTGTWWLTARSLTPGPDEPEATLAKASTFEAKSAGQTLTLPVDDNVRSWAAACK